MLFSKVGDVALGCTAMFYHGVFPFRHDCVLAVTAMQCVRLRLQRVGVVICALCFPAKKWDVMKIKPSHARLRQRALGKNSISLGSCWKKFELINQKMPCQTAAVTSFAKIAFRLPIPLTQTDISESKQNNAQDMNFLENTWRGWNRILWSLKYYNQLTFDRPNPFIPAHIYHRLCSFFFFSIWLL